MYWLGSSEARERYAEMLRKAEEERRIRHLPVAPGRFERAIRALCQRSLAYLGQTLVVWGLFLKARSKVHFGSLPSALPKQDG